MGGSFPPGSVEPDKSSLWMDLFSLDSVILIVVTCKNCLPFSSAFEADFSERYLMTSAENSVSEHPNLKIFWGKGPPTRLVPLMIMSSPYKKPSDGPEFFNREHNTCSFLITDSFLFRAVTSATKTVECGC